MGKPTRGQSVYRAAADQSMVAGKSAGRSGSINFRKRTKALLAATLNERFPVLQNVTRSGAVQMDWTSARQGVTFQLLGDTTANIETKYAKMVDTSYYFPSASTLPHTGTFPDTQTTYRMRIFGLKNVVNYKNTCTHTCMLEMRVYKVKGYHSTTFLNAWTASLVDDNVINPITSGFFTSEETIDSYKKRPDMRLANLGVLYSEVASARARYVLEPGQATTYTFSRPPIVFDRARYNVAINGSDVDFCPYTYVLVTFAHAEMVTDPDSDAVVPGSGHIATNMETYAKWTCMPYVKLIQNCATEGWRPITGVEGDSNIYDVQPEPYDEDV